MAVFGGVKTEVAPGTVFIIPTEIEQFGALYEREDISWSRRTNQYKIYKIWASQGKPKDENRWAYITVAGQKRYLVALAQTFGFPGDYVDIYVNNGSGEVVYPCLLGDTKGFHASNHADNTNHGIFWYNGVAYGHYYGGKCDVIEIILCNYNVRPSSDFLHSLIPVTKIINGGSYFDYPNGPVGLEGTSYFTGPGSNSDEPDLESNTFLGAIGSLARRFWDVICTVFENHSEGRNDITVLYRFKKESNRTTTNIDGFVQYYQNDYKNVPYGRKSIATSGCGPTAFAMVASTISKTQITPADAISWCGNKYYISGVGTSWSYFAAAKEHFNLNCTLKETKSIDEVVSALMSGGLVISSQGPGLFTSGGHFIVLSGMSDGKIMVRDPNKNNAVNKGYNDRLFTAEEIDEAKKNYWIFSY